MDDEYEFIIDPKFLEFLMAFSRSGLRVKIGRAILSDLPTITDLAAVPLTDDVIRLSYFANVSFYQYRIDGGSAVALTTNDIAGLDAETEYDFEIRGGHFAIGPWSEWSNVATAITLEEPDAAIGSIADLTAIALGETSVQLAFTNATNAGAYQYRIDGGSPVTLAGSRVVSGLTENTEYDFEVRGANVGLTIFGAYSNLVTETTDETPPPGEFDPIDYLTAGEQTQLDTEYGITTIPFTRVWGVAGEPSCPYREPTYDVTGAGIPANALDRSAYASTDLWLADMEVQQKPGKIKWTASAYSPPSSDATIGTQSIYGYNDQGGQARPHFSGSTWRHYVQGDNCRFQFLKRSGSELWLIVQDNHTAYMTTSQYRYSFFEGAGAQYKRLADHTGFYVLDCEFDNVLWPILGLTYNYRLKKVHIGRNTYRNGCKIIGNFTSRLFGDANVNGGNGIYFYGNDLDDAEHNPTAASQWGSQYYTIMGVVSSDVEAATLRPTNGPTFVENNRVTNVIGCGLPKRQNNIAVAADIRESNFQRIRYNEVENVYSNLYASDCQAFYSKGTILIEENYARNFGSAEGQLFNSPFASGFQDADGWNTDENSASEGSFCSLKGGGGYDPGYTTVKNNICIPLFSSTPVIMTGHRSQISGNYIFNWLSHARGGNHCTIIRTSHPGNNSPIGTNYFVGCGSHPYNNNRMQWVATSIGGGATQANATDDIADLVVDFDSNRRDVFWAVDTITNSFNGAAATLQKASAFAPMNHGRPTMIRSGGNFVINSSGAWNLGPMDFAAGTVPLTYEWYRNGVIIGGQTASSMSEGQWTGTIEGVVVGTIGGKATRARAWPPFHKIVSELVPGGPATFVDSSSTAGVTQDYALGTLTAGDKYRITFNQNVDIATFIRARLTGTAGAVIRPGEIHANSRAGTFVYEFVAQTGENNLRFITASSSIVTISNISVGKITGEHVLGQAW